jgi:molybdopterin-guanine dinucleotide biosynthesis protein A
MGRDKALLEVGGIPLWRRQLAILEELQPREIFISGPPREEWRNHIVVPDAQTEVGPLGGLISALHRCPTSLLLVLAIDLPKMAAWYFRELLDSCSECEGVIPRGAHGFEPLAAIYPTTALPVAGNCLHAGDYSLQGFATQCVAKGLVRPIEITTSAERLFVNLNTPDDLLALTTP